MKLKKLLASILCVAMVLSTMSFSVFAAEEPVAASEEGMQIPVVEDVNTEAATYWSGKADTSWYEEGKTEFTLTTPEQLAGLAKLVDEYDVYDDEEKCYLAFENVTIKLGANIDLYADGNGEPVSFNPIGSYSFEKAFAGTFDGQGHTISNMYQSGWALENGLWDGDDCGLGLFGLLYNAKVENLKINNADLPTECNLIGFVAGAAYGDCTFKDITITNSYSGNHSYYSGGIVGWASGNHSYINCDLDETNVISSQWGDFNNALGGIIGGTGKNGVYHIEDCDVACVLDAFNDITSAYEWHSYRNCGMLVGNTGKTVEKDGTVYADTSHITTVNNKVVYGEWANYTYCQFNAMGYPWVRVEAGESTSAYGNARYYPAYDANGDAVIDENHVHNDGEGHNVMIPLCQLFGGPVSGDGRACIYGEAIKEGVEVTDNAKEARAVAEVWAPETTARSGGLVKVDSYETLAEALAAVEDGYTIKLVKDIEYNEDNAIVSADGQWKDGLVYTGDKSFTIDLNGHTISDNGDLNDYLIYFKNEGTKDNAITLINGTISAGPNVWAGICVGKSSATGATTLNLGQGLVVEGDGSGRAGSENALIKNRYNSVVNILDGATINIGSDIMYGVSTGGYNDVKPQLNIDDGAVITSDNSKGIAVTGNGILNIKGGIITSKGWAVYTSTSGQAEVTISGGTVKGEKGAVASAADLSSYSDAAPVVKISGGLIEGEIAALEWGTSTESEGSELTVEGGSFTKDPTEYLAEGYIIATDEYGYYAPVVDNSGTENKAVATRITASLVPVEGNPNKYDVVLTAEDNAEIHRFLSAELNISLIPDVADKSPVYIKNVKGNAAYGIEVINPDYNESGVWGFHLDENAIEATANKLTIATVELAGYGEAKFYIAPHTKNKVEAVQSVENNIVKKYLVDNADDKVLVIDQTINYVDLEVPTKDLTIEITFPNVIEDQVAAYQDMTVTVEGKDIETITKNLGKDGDVQLETSADGKVVQYVITLDDELTENNSYNITVTGAGYRTAEYRVTMTEDKTVYFWNDAVKGEAIPFEKDGVLKAKTSFLAGDIAEDNIIDKYDLAAVVSYFGRYGLTSSEDTYKYAKYDLNRDGKIDSEDIAYVLASFGY